MDKVIYNGNVITIAEDNEVETYAIATQLAGCKFYEMEADDIAGLKGLGYDVNTVIVKRNCDGNEEYILTTKRQMEAVKKMKIEILNLQSTSGKTDAPATPEDIACIIEEKFANGII